MNTRSNTRSPATLAAVCAGAVIANQVAGRATRDGLFLSSFDIAALPAMYFAAALLSLVTLLWASGAMSRMSPARLIPAMFTFSGVLLLAEWGLMFRSRELAAIALYLHTAALGAFLVSGFWSIVNERFDPRAARQHVGRIAGGAALGGLAGGFVAERIAALATVSTMLPLMGIIHFGCAVLVVRLCAAAPAHTAAPRPNRETATSVRFAGIRVVATSPYLRTLAGLVLLTAASATLLDYVFKARAFEAFGQGAELTRFFALFHTAVGLGGFVFQTLLSRRVLQRLGLAGTTATLPVVTTIGSLATLILPGLAPISVVRGAEASVSNSLFRSGYELLYVPVPLAQKRSAKSIIDVGVDRIADSLAAAIIFALLFLPSTMALRSVIVVALGSGVAAILVTRRIRPRYGRALKDHLVDRADQAGVRASAADADSVLMRTIGDLDVRTLLGQDMPPGRPTPRDSEESTSPHPDAVHDPLVIAMTDLRSGDADRVRKRLLGEVNRVLAPQVVQLLAWDSVSDVAIVALRGMCPTIVGELTDALLDPNSDFAVRRRIPRILATCDSSRSVAGLLLGLEDGRFEVRFQSAVALSRIQGLKPDTLIPENHILRIVKKELGVSVPGWTNRKLVEPEAIPEEDTLVSDRLNLSLTHVFRLLSLVFEKEPMTIALRGLHTDDAFLRGTAIEYLENVLPRDVFEKLNRFLPEDRPLPATSARVRRRDPRSELLLSRHSIEINLEKLREHGLTDG